MAKMETGKQAMIAKAITPKKIRIELVVIFMSHLHIVLLMDGALKINVPHIGACYKTVTYSIDLLHKYQEKQPQNTPFVPRAHGARWQRPLRKALIAHFLCVLCGKEE